MTKKTFTDKSGKVAERRVVKEKAAINIALSFSLSEVAMLYVNTLDDETLMRLATDPKTGNFYLGSGEA